MIEIELLNGGSEVGREHISKNDSVVCKKWTKKRLKILTLIYLLVLIVSQLTTPTGALFHDTTIIEGTLLVEREFNEDIKEEEAFQGNVESSDDQNSAETFGHIDVKQEDDDTKEATSDSNERFNGQDVHEFAETSEEPDQANTLDHQAGAELDSKKELEGQAGTDQPDIEEEDRGDGEIEREDQS